MSKKTLIRIIILCSLVLALCILCAVMLEADRGDQSPSRPTDETPTADSTGTTGSTEQTNPPTGTTGVTETTQAPTESKEGAFVLSFVGDCTLGSMPEWMSYSYSFTSVVKDNYDLPFRNVRDIFEGDDCTFANLEGVFANDGKPEEKRFTFRGPTSYINILTGSSVEAVSLANNHSYDFGEEGYLSTKKVLQEGGVEYAEKNGSTLITTESGLTIGLYAVLYTLDEADLKAEVAQMKAAGAEVIVAAIHWGDEARYKVNQTQINTGHALIDGGVDIVWGHHPHVLQRIEEYNGGIIFYSLGNFSFGGNHNPKDKDTAVLQQEILRDADGNISLGELNIIPCCISSVTTRNNFQPTPCDEDSERYQRVLSKLDGTFKAVSTQESDPKPTTPTTPTTPATPTAPPEPTEPEVTEPEVTEPEVTEPEVTEPEVTEPEVTEPEVTEPEVTEPEVTGPEGSEPEDNPAEGSQDSTQSTESGAPGDGSATPQS